MRSAYWGVLLVALAACSGDKSAEESIQQARAYSAASDYKAATIELKNALREDAELAEARWLLGKAYLELGDIPSAEKELLRAHSLGWSEDDTYPALADTWLAQGKLDEVLQLNSNKLSPLPASELLSGQALAELASGNAGEAGRLVALALEKNPESNAARLVEARLLATNGDSTGSLIVLEEVLETAPENANAWRLKGDILLQLRELEEARDAFTNAIDFSTMAFGDRVKRALINLQLEDYPAAQKDASALLKVAPQHPAGNYVQGLIHFQNKSYKEAITALSVAEPVASSYPLVLFYLSSSHLMEGNFDQATVFANRFVSQVPGNANGRKLLATLYLQESKAKKAREVIQPLIDSNPNDVEALNIMANALLSEGQTDEGLDLLARIASLQPDSPVAQMRLGAGLMISGKQDEASEHLEAALDISPEFQQADILLVMNHLQKGDFDAAITAAKAYQRRNIGKVAPYNLLGRVYLAAGRTDDAVEAFNRAIAIDAGDPSSHLSLASMALAGDDTSAAREHYNLVLEHHADNLPTLLQLAALEAREQNEGEMVSRLRQAIDKHPAVLEPRLLLARYYLGTGKAAQVTPLFADLNNLQRQSPAVLELTALAQIASRDHSVAEASLDQLISANPEIAHYHYLQAMAAEGNGNGEKMRRELKTAHELDAQHVPTLLALTRLALAEQREDDFNEKLKVLRQLAPGTPAVLRLEAIAAQREGNSVEAVRLASQVYEASPSTQSVLELAAYQKAGGETQAAEALLEQWIAQHPNDVAVRLARANALQVANDVEAAQAQYLAVVENDPENVIALNNLAWNLRESDPKQALEYIRRAAILAPERPEVLDTLAIIEHINGENRSAYRNIERALDRAPGVPSILYHKAMIAAALGEKEKAIDVLEGLLSEGAPVFPEQAEAETLLQSLKG